MATWITEAEIAVLLFVLAIPVLVFPAVHGLYRRYDRMPFLPSALVGAAVLYAFGLVAFTLFPIPADSAAACANETAGWRIEPLASFREAADEASRLGPGSFLTSAAFLQEVMNVVLLMPLGILIGLSGRRPWWVAAAAGLGVSLLIETTQGTGVWGLYDCPYRLAEFDDLLTNTTGAVLGWFVGRWMAGWLRWPAPVGFDRAELDDEQPSVGRRFVAVMLDFVAVGVVAGALQFGLALGATIIGVGNTPSAWPGPVVFVAGTLGPLLVVAVAIPLIRSDRASPGQITTLLHPVDGRGQPPGAKELLVRTAVRWSPLLLAATATSWGRAVFFVAAAVQLGTVLLRADRASLAALASGCRTATNTRAQVVT